MKDCLQSLAIKWNTMEKQKFHLTISIHYYMPQPIIPLVPTCTTKDFFLWMGFNWHLANFLFLNKSNINLLKWRYCAIKNCDIHKYKGLKTKINMDLSFRILVLKGVKVLEYHLFSIYYNFKFSEFFSIHYNFKLSQFFLKLL